MTVPLTCEHCGKPIRPVLKSDGWYAQIAATGGQVYIHTNGKFYCNDVKQGEEITTRAWPVHQTGQTGQTC